MSRKLVSEKYAKRLAPLMVLEQRLMRQLSFPEEDDDPSSAAFNDASATNASSGSGRQPWPWSVSQVPTPPKRNLRTSSSSAYASTFALSTSPSSISPAASSATVSVSKSGELALRPGRSRCVSGTRSPKSPHTNEMSGGWEDADDPVHVWGMMS